MPPHHRGKTHKKRKTPNAPLRLNAEEYVPRHVRNASQNRRNMNRYLDEIRNVTTRNRNNSKSMENLLRKINAKRRRSLKGGYEHLLTMLRRGYPSHKPNGPNGATRRSLNKNKGPQEQA
jgi:hypothetical protein